MRNKLITTLVMAGVLVVSGCASNGQMNNKQAGAVIGGILGGVLGSRVGKGSGRTAAIIAGTMMGAYIGGSVGQSMDDVDRMKTSRVMETASSGQSTTWHNPDSGNAYTVTPTRTYYEDKAEKSPCREYTIFAEIDGKAETVKGTACRQPDGSWITQS